MKIKFGHQTYNCVESVFVLSILTGKGKTMIGH